MLGAPVLNGLFDVSKAGRQVPGREKKESVLRLILNANRRRHPLIAVFHAMGKSAHRRSKGVDMVGIGHHGRVLNFRMEPEWLKNQAIGHSVPNTLADNIGSHGDGLAVGLWGPPTHPTQCLFSPTSTFVNDGRKPSNESGVVRRLRTRLQIWSRVHVVPPRAHENLNEKVAATNHLARQSVRVVHTPATARNTLIYSSPARTKRHPKKRKT